jgi:hypothetical protein
MRDMNPVPTAPPAQPRRAAQPLVTVVVAAVAAAMLCGAGLYALRRATDLVRTGVSVDRCHPDAETAATLRREAALTTAPPGAALGELREELPCGRPIRRGVLAHEVTGAGQVPEVSAFYETLATRGGWQAGGGSGVYTARKPDGHGCRWELAVRNTAAGTYHVQISYVPRDRSTACP